MMGAAVSAGLVMYRLSDDQLEVFLVHPGGPYYRSKDLGVWSIPKGEPGADEDLEQTARREFFEETGIAPQDPLIPLGSIRQAGGKVVHAWAFQGDWQPDQKLTSNHFEMEWPPRSGKRVSFPEIDQGGFFPLGSARQRILPAQGPLLDRLQAQLAGA
jgi:predicted NUDIX family NTP pyrophosphohydrolase